MAVVISAAGRGIAGWGEEGLPACGHGAEEAEQRGNVVGPSQADQVEPLGGELLGLWHPGLWHLLVSEVQDVAGAGGVEAVGAGA